MSRRDKIMAKKYPGVLRDGTGEMVTNLKADIIFRCGRCKALLWHAHAHITAAQAAWHRSPDAPRRPDFDPYLVEPTEDAGGIGRLAYLHVPMIPIRTWDEAEGSETQDCLGCGHHASISRRQAYRRLRALWDEAEAAGESRRLVVET
jgi:hypothetical protein